MIDRGQTKRLSDHRPDMREDVVRDEGRVSRGRDLEGKDEKRVKMRRGQDEKRERERHWAMALTLTDLLATTLSGSG